MNQVLHMKLNLGIFFLRLWKTNIWEFHQGIHTVVVMQFAYHALMECSVMRLGCWSRSKLPAFTFESQSEGVPHEVFGPWVWWGKGQVISGLSRRRRRRRRVVVVAPLPPPKKKDIGTLGQNMLKITLKWSFSGVLFFPGIVFFFWKKKSTATQAEQGSKRGPFVPIYKKIFVWCW